MPGLNVFLNLAGNYQPQMAAVANQTVAANARMAASAEGMAAAQNIAMQQVVNASQTAGVTINQTNNTINRTASAAKNAAAETSKLNTIFGQFLVIAREIARGQWARAISSFTRLLQTMGAAATTLVPVLALVGSVAYITYEHFKAVAYGAELASDRIGKLTGKVEALVRAFRGTMDEGNSFQDWLEKLHEIGQDNSLTKQTDDEIAAMRRKFNLEQQAARVSGQTPAQRTQAEKKEAQDESAKYEAAAKNAAEKREAAENKVIQRHTVLGPQIEQEKAQLEELTRQADKARKEHEAMLATGRSSAAMRSADAAKSLITGEDYSLNPLITFTMDGKDVNDRQGNVAGRTVATERARRDAASKLHADEEELRKLKKAAEEAAHDASSLLEKANRARDIAHAEGEVDTDVSKPAKQKHMGMLTELQKIGAFVGPSVSLIDVNKRISRDVAQIRHHMTTRGGAAGTVSSPGGYD